jgi:transcriptional regulator with XRE-family HTH domain
MTAPKERGPMQKLLNKGETLKGLAERTGISYETLKSYNQGKHEPSLKNAIAIAKAQNLSLVAIGEAFGFDVKGLPYA